MSKKQKPRPFIGQGTAAECDVDGGIGATLGSLEVSMAGSVGVSKSPSSRVIFGEGSVQAGPATIQAETVIVRSVEPPWTRLAGFLHSLFGNRFYKDVLKPTLADYEYDVRAALENDGTKQIKAIRFRCLTYLVFGTLTWVSQLIRVPLALFLAALFGSKCS